MWYWIVAIALVALISFIIGFIFGVKAVKKHNTLTGKLVVDKSLGYPMLFTEVPQGFDPNKLREGDYVTFVVKYKNYAEEKKNGN